MRDLSFKFILIFLFFILSHKIFYIFFEVYETNGTSMRPNFEDKEKFFVYPNYYKDKEVNYGDVVILKFKNEEGVFVKRIVGLPNDKVEIRNGILLVNGKEKTSKNELELNIFIENITPEISYKILNAEKNDSEFDSKSVTVSKGHYFVLGDNRQNSGDSRDYGTISKNQILHKFISRKNFIYNFSFYFF